MNKEQKKEEWKEEIIIAGMEMSIEYYEKKLYNTCTKNFEGDLLEEIYLEILVELKDKLKVLEFKK